MGELTRPLLLREPRISVWAATGSIAAERILDGLFVCAVLLLGLGLSTPLDPLPDHLGTLPIPVALIPKAAYAATGIFGTAFIALAVYYAQRERAHRVTERCLSLASPRFARWVTGKLEGLAAGIGFLPNPRLLTSFLLVSILYWVLSIGATWVLALGTGFSDLSLPEASVLVTVVALGILVPNAPGFFGTFQLSVYAGLAMFFMPERIETAGAAFVFVMYVVQVAVLLAGGALGWWLLRSSPRRKVGLCAPEPHEITPL